MLQIGQINDNLLFNCQSGEDLDMKKRVGKDGLDKNMFKYQSSLNVNK